MLKTVQWSRDSRLGLARGLRLASRQKLHTLRACRVKLGKSFLARYRNICHFNFLFPAQRIITGMSMPPLFLIIPLKDSRLILLLAYVKTNLEGKSNRGLGEIIALSPSGGTREKPWLPTNSFSNEVITACQYPCIARVQRPSFSELETVTAVKCWLQNSKAVGCRKGRIEVGDSIRKERSSRMSRSSPNCLLTWLVG